MPKDVDLKKLFHHPGFPRSNGYAAGWVARNQMGPNALWLAEWLSQELELTPGMRVLDLGCGTAMSSIFLAREFGVTVFATDLWIQAADNWARISEAGLENSVFPIRAEAHALPFAPGFFDAIVALDSFGYFGTDVLYLSYIARYLKAGGQIGIVAPGFMQPVGDEPPEHLTRPQANGRVFWEPDVWSFKTVEWWRRHWKRSELVDVVTADTLPDGWRAWAQHERAVEASGLGVFPSDAETIEADAGRYLGFVRIVARRRTPQEGEQPMPHVWEPEFSTVCAELRDAAAQSGDDAQ